MVINTCTSGVVLTTLVTLLLVPARYWLPCLQPAAPPPGPHSLLGVLSATVRQSPYPVVDLLLMGSLIFMSICAYLSVWIQRRLTERRIHKINRQLSEVTEMLRATAARQQQLEGTARAVRAAAAEYDLLLLLLLRRRRLAAPARDPHNCFYDKEPDELNFLTDPLDGYGTNAL